MQKEYIQTLVNLLAQGKIVVPAEVRTAHGRVLKLKARPAEGDKPARPESQMSLVELHVELGEQAYITPLPVRLVLEEGQNPEEFAKSLTRGSLVFIEVKNIRGEFGRIEALDARAVYAAA